MVVLAFVPSSLMLGVTTFLSTDVAAIPLFWVVPLSLYLFSFIIVFARVPPLIHRIAVGLLPVTVTCLIFVTFSDIGIPQWILFLFHLVNFFVYSLLYHGEIGRSRPTTMHLTEYYFFISLGGVLGGIFNALLAPVLFNSVLEYPLVLALGALLLPVRFHSRKAYPRRVWKQAILYLVAPVVLVPFTYWLTTASPLESVDIGWLVNVLHMPREGFETAVSYGVPLLLCLGLAFVRRPFLFGIGATAVLMTVIVSEDLTRNIVHRERSFFGVLTVTKDSDGKFMTLFHGTTLHGKQWLDPERRLEPLTYYHREGPVGQVFSEFSGDTGKARIAVAGLGTGTLASYGQPGQEVDYYEIDQAVKRIAANPRYFTFLSGCQAKLRVVLGDARLMMRNAPENGYGMIILDAFSSDAIPVHLLTREAVNLYLSKLSEDGVLLVHISNRYVDLAPVLANLADEAGLAGIIGDVGEDGRNERYSSTWVLLARKEADLGGLPGNGTWEKMQPDPNIKVWTDDFSDLVSVFRW